MGALLKKCHVDVAGVAVLVVGGSSGSGSGDWVCGVFGEVVM